MNLYDYHIHSNVSHDGKNSIIEICKKAIELNFKEISITDHYDPTFEDKYGYNPNQYFEDIVKAKSIFKDHITIRSGVEMGQPHLHQEGSKMLLKNYKFDYILISLHEFTMKNKVIDLMEIDFQQSSWLEYFNGYLDHMQEMIKWENYSCVGHIDLPKRYMSAHGVIIDENNYMGRLEHIFKELIHKGKGIEVNTSGLRQAPKECFPSYNILKLYKELGGEIITIGSDAHNTCDLGKGIIDGLEMLYSIGFNYITYFEEGIPKFNRLKRSA